MCPAGNDIADRTCAHQAKSNHGAVGWSDITGNDRLNLTDEACRRDDHVIGILRQGSMTAFADEVNVDFGCAGKKGAEACADRPSR